MKIIDMATQLLHYLQQYNDQEGRLDRSPVVRIIACPLEATFTLFYHFLTINHSNEAIRIYLLFSLHAIIRADDRIPWSICSSTCLPLAVSYNSINLVFTFDSLPLNTISIQAMAHLLEEEINQLDDDVLFERLRVFKPHLGPVVDSTRGLYRKMLLNCQLDSLGN